MIVYNSTGQQQQREKEEEEEQQHLRCCLVTAGFANKTSKKSRASRHTYDKFAS